MALLIMKCAQAREAMSAHMDGELSAAAETLMAEHVKDCPDCQAWREAAFEVTRRVRMTGWSPSDDVVSSILSNVPRRRFGGVGSWLRPVLLLAAAIGQLVLTVPLLVGSANGMGMHDLHELAVFDFALAVAFLVGAIRPRLANGLAWPCGAAATGLIITAVLDVADHHTFEVHELRHLIAVAGAAVLCWSARAQSHPDPDTVLAETIAIQSRRNRRAALPFSVGHDVDGQAPPAASTAHGAA